ncbi:MAG TPA: hypothetical protein VLY87_03235 [Flavobacterium sp.]|nr:hypothetical protein [Flavobacterium sp.]
MGTIVISKKENNTFKYTYNNRKGHTLLSSNSHETKAHCMSEINVLKRNFSSIEYLRYKTPSGKLYFKININTHILGTSRKFTTPLLMDKGLNDFKNNFISSEVLDFCEDIFESFPEIIFDEI